MDIKKRLILAVRNVILAFFVVIQIAPLIWLFLFAFKDNHQIFNNPAFALPSPVIWENFKIVFQGLKIQTFLINSVLVTVATVAVTLLFSSMAAYACVRMRWKYGKWMIMLFLAGIMIPVHASLLPLFILFKKMGILNSLWSLIIPYTAFALPTAMFIFTGFLKNLPLELEEAACMDGCNVSQLFFRIILPLMKIPMSVVSIFTFLNAWNELMFALTFTTDMTKKTLPVAVMSFQGIFVTDWGPIGAAMLVATAPTFIIYLCLSEQMQKSMLQGAVKG